MAQYTVQPGDYAIKIARKFGMTLGEFKQLNPGLNIDVLFPGQLVQVRGAVIGAPPVSSGGSGPPPASSWHGPPPWMQIAISEQGTREWNPGDNPRIQQYLASVNIVGPDETSWCAAFVQWCLRGAGFQGANSGRASDWFRWGRPVAATYGAIVLFQPLSAGASGHVGFLHALDQRNVWLLSGNSSNQVRIAAYPKDKLIHTAPYRWPY